MPARLRVGLGVVEHLVRLLLHRHPTQQVLDPGRGRLVPVLVRLDRAVLVQVTHAVDDRYPVAHDGHRGQVQTERADIRRAGRPRGVDRHDVPLVGPPVRDVPRRRVAGSGRLRDLRVQVEQTSRGGEVVVATADVDPHLVANGPGYRGPGERRPPGAGDHRTIAWGGQRELTRARGWAGRPGQHRRRGARGVDGAVHLELPQRVSVAGRAGGAVHTHVPTGTADGEVLHAALSRGGCVEGGPCGGVVGHVDVI